MRFAPLLRRRRITGILLLAALAGCGGGGGGGGTASIPTGSRSASGPTATASVTVTVPNAPATSSTKRRPAYLTSYTQGIDLQAVQGGVASGYVFYPLSALQSNCQAQTNGYVCTLQVTVPVGNSQIVVNTYDNTAKATSNILSTASVNISAAVGAANTFAVTTNPIVANLNGGNNSAFNCPTIGVPSSTSFTYTTTDADGGTLSGTIGNTITIQDSDTTGTTSVSPATLTSATGTLTVNYNGGVPLNGVALFSAMASITPQGVANGSLGGTGITPVNATPAGPHFVYISDAANNNIYSFDVCARSTNNTFSQPIPLPPGTNPADLIFDRFSWNANHAIMHLVAMGLNNTLVVVDISTGSVLQTVTLPGTPHHMQATAADSSGDALFVTVDPNKVLKYGLRSISPYLTTPTTIIVGNAPRGINLEGFGNDGLVANSADGTVTAFNPSSGVVDATLSIGVNPGGIPGPSADGLCTLVTDKGNNMVYALKTQATGTSTITRIGSPIALPGQPQSSTFFPGSNTAIVTTNSGGAVLVTCSGGTSFTQTATWTNFMSNPAANIPSSYVTPATGPGAPLKAANTTSVYVVGISSGQPALQAYNVGQNTPLFGNQLPTNANPSSIVAGP